MKESNTLLDLKSHFNHFNSARFFDDKSYHDLSIDVHFFSKLLECHYNEEKLIALKFESPYLNFVAHLACLLNNKIAVIISSKETLSALEILKNQVAYNYVIDDQHFKHSNDPLSVFPLVNSSECSTILFTSGSSSYPKGVALSFSNIFYSAKGFSDFFKQTSFDCSYMNLPHHHIGGLMIMWRAFLTGGRITTSLADQIDFISLVPSQLRRWLREADKIQHLKKSKATLIGGACLPADLAEVAKINNISLFETYGMTETTSLVMINGTALPYRQIKIDRDGFILTKGEVLSLGYFQNKIFSPHSQNLIDGWFKTSDKGFINQEGLLQFDHRADLIFISGGENINPLSIEETVKLHPKIKEAYLTSLEDEFWGEAGCLFFEINNNESLSTDDLKAFLKEKLHPHHVPKYFFETTFMQTFGVKIKRSELKIQAKEYYLKSIFSYNYYQIKNAPTLVLFHGFLGNKGDLEEITEKIKNRYSLLFLDLPGHGETRIKNFSSTPDLFKKLSEFISLFDKSPHLYGYSMGGRVALHLALNYLFSVQSLTLESAGLGLNSSEEKENRIINDLKIFDGYNQDTILNFIHNWYKNSIFDRYRSSHEFEEHCLKKSQHQLVEWRDSQNFLSQACLPLLTENRDKLRALHFPIHYFYGEEDLKYKKLARENLNSISKAHIEIFEIKKASHNPHKTHPTEIAETMSILLK